MAADHPSTPVSGEVTHESLCRWQQATAADCEYRETHHYCPHPEHACNCAEIRRQLARVDREADYAVGAVGGASPSRETTKREEWVVQHALPENALAWADRIACPTEVKGISALRRSRASYRHPFRLVHRIVTETVVEGPADAR